MQIQPKISQNINFQNAKLKKALELVPETKVSKGLTRLDVAAFKKYVSAIPYRTGITLDDVKNLKVFNGDKFITNSFKFLCNKLGFSENIRPGLSIVDEMYHDGFMSYVPANNIVMVNRTKLKNLSKDHIFALIRHEIQHYIQNILALRHETIGKQAIDIMAENNLKTSIAIAENLFNSLSDQGIKEIYGEMPDVYNFVMHTKKLYESGNRTAFIDSMKINSEIYKENLLIWQRKLIDELGQIPKDSALTPKIKQNFEELQNTGYYEANGQINPERYSRSKIEQEAENAQFAAEIEFNPFECGIKQIKDATIQAYSEKYI